MKYFLAACLAVTVAASASGPVNSERLIKAEAEPANWFMYSGNYHAHRYSALDQINASNVHQLRLKWIFQMKTTHHVETTPLVVDGIMYATRPPSDVVALDARTGRKFWEFNYPVPADVHTCCGLVNRGLAILGDRLFMATIDAHVVSLDAKSGRMLWNVKQADYQAGYSGTVAPLVVKNKVIFGIAGGENGIRGFLDAYDAATGNRLWRFYTIPGPSDPHFGTWEGDSWKTGGGATWVTGSYDPDLNLIYWGVGNPGPDWNDDHRAGDNLYTNSVVAIDADTGKLKWHFQFTPHDTHDWDSTQIPVLAELNIRGRQRKVLVLPNRNGFYYVLDRATGEFLLARQYVEKQTWAGEIDEKGRPVLIGKNTPTEIGVSTWPGTDGGMSWYSPSFNPKTGLLYVPNREKGMIYYKTQAVYRPGLSFSGGGTKDDPGDAGYGVILAIQPDTGEIRWRHKLLNPMRSGVLSTAGNLVFGSTMEGNVFALDATTGKDLWHFPGNDVSYASPMSYACDGKQYVAIPIGDVLMAFGLE